MVSPGEYLQKLVEDVDNQKVRLQGVSVTSDIKDVTKPSDEFRHYEETGDIVFHISASRGKKKND